MQFPRNRPNGQAEIATTGQRGVARIGVPGAGAYEFDSDISYQNGFEN